MDRRAWWATVDGVTEESDMVTLWTVAHQALLSMEFPRQEYWSGLPFLSPGDLSNPVNAGVQPRWIQGIRRVDGVGVERLVCLLM